MNIRYLPTSLLGQDWLTPHYCAECFALQLLFLQPQTIRIQVKGSKKNLYHHPSSRIGNTLHILLFVGLKLVFLCLLLFYELGVLVYLAIIFG